MTSEIGFNSAQFLQLNNDIRISSTQTFNAQEAYENAFEDVLLEQVSKTQEIEQNKCDIKYYNLGVPAGFIMDNSLLEQMEFAESGSSSSDSKNLFNPYMMVES